MRPESLKGQIFLPKVFSRLSLHWVDRQDPSPLWLPEMPCQPAGHLAETEVSYSAGYTEQFQLRRRIIPCMEVGNSSNVRIVRLVTQKNKL